MYFVSVCGSINKNWNIDDCSWTEKGWTVILDSPLCGPFSVLCRIKLKQKEQFDYIRIIHKLSIKISCSSEGTFYNWKRNDAEQTASLCIVIHGLIVIFRVCLCLCTCAWERVVTVQSGRNRGCNSRSNPPGHAFFEMANEKVSICSALLVGGRSGWTCGWAEECWLSRSDCPFYETIAVKVG